MSYVKGGFGMSEANQRVFNLKKPMERRGLPDWHYKQEAIAVFGHDLASFLAKMPLRQHEAVIVPMPTSKRRDDPLYDDRLVQACEIASELVGVPILDCFEVGESVSPSHMGGTRSVDAIRENLAIPEARQLERFDVCVLVDDVVSTGAHYAACWELLASVSPDLAVLAAFWAKWEPIDEDGFVYGSGPL